MVALIQSKNHAANQEKTAGRYQFDTNPSGIGLTVLLNQQFVKTVKLYSNRTPLLI